MSNPMRLSISLRCQVLARLDNPNVARAIAKEIRARDGEVELIQDAIAETRITMEWLRDHEARIKAALATGAGS